MVGDEFVIIPTNDTPLTSKLATNTFFKFDLDVYVKKGTNIEKLYDELKEETGDPLEIAGMNFCGIDFKYRCEFCIPNKEIDRAAKEKRLLNTLAENFKKAHTRSGVYADILFLKDVESGYIPTGTISIEVETTIKDRIIKEVGDYIDKSFKEDFYWF